MRFLFHILIILSILLTAAVYSALPNIQFGNIWAKYHFASLQFFQSYLNESLFSNFLALPLWQGLIGLTFVFYLFSRLFKA